MEDKIKGIALLLFGILLSCAQDGLNDTIFASMSEIPFAFCRTVRWHRWALPCVWQIKGQITAILSPASLLLAVWPVRVIIAVYKFVCRTGS